MIHLKKSSIYNKDPSTQYLNSIMSHNIQKSLDFSWQENKTIRADIISNKQIATILIKIVIFLFAICYLSRMLPDARETTTYTPQIWSQIDILQVHKVSPLNRVLKIYAAPSNESADIDQITQVQVFSLLDNQQKQKIMDLAVEDLNDYTDISKNQLRFLFGDIHILADVAYRLKVIKPIKLQRRILDNQVQKQKDQINNQVKNETETEQKTISSEKNQTEEQKLTNQTKEQQKQINQTISENKNATQDQQEEKRKQQQQKKKKQQQQKQQQRKKKQQEEKQKERAKIEEEKKIQQEAKRKQQQEQRKKRQEEQERMRKIQEYTNIKLLIEMKSSFATVLQLIIKYISILVIIYMATDNKDGPLTIAIICAIISNPLLFLQISFPNSVSNVIDCLCKSAHILFMCLWIYYIHTKSKFYDKMQYRVYLSIKMVLCFLLYLLNFFRLLHFQVFFVQTVLAICLTVFLSIYLWDTYLNLQYQHHRDKILFSVTLTFICCLFTLNVLSGDWRNEMAFLIYQIYGLFMLYLMSSPKKNKKLSKISSEQLQNDRKNEEKQYQHKQLNQQIQLK